MTRTGVACGASLRSSGTVAPIGLAEAGIDMSQEVSSLVTKPVSISQAAAEFIPEEGGTFGVLEEAGIARAVILFEAGGDGGVDGDDFVEAGFVEHGAIADIEREHHLFGDARAETA